MNQKPPAADPTDRVMKIPPVESPRHEEALLDQAVAETFPASDPISPASAALMEPADVNYESLTDQSSKLRERMRRNAPALIAIGTAAVALLAMRALRGGRAAGRGDGSGYE
ncbi:MAG TPA: hypothetical protein VFN64_13285 [Burkholderiaceae bacterium]|nr:hypothetical protein [Burkholderiaceae bacterium]